MQGVYLQIRTDLACNNSLKGQEKMAHRFYDAKNDIAFRRLFAREENKPLLISFLNAVLRREGEDLIQEVTILPPELVPNIAEAKRSVLDVRCRDSKNFEYVVEMQNRKLTSFVQRAQYYASRAYIEQLWQGDVYLELRPVILLAILNHKIFPDDVGVISYHHTLETETQRHYLKDISYAFIELDKFTKGWDDLETIEDQWLYLLKKAKETDETPPHASQEILQAYETLEQYRWTEGEREAYERARMSIMDEADMLSTAIEEGLEKGREEGREEVRQEKEVALKKAEEEKEIALKKAKIEMAKTLLLKGIDIEIISETTGLSMEEMKKLYS
jgi:predicted transposase/invertase (TIGR01784 family)